MVRQAFFKFSLLDTEKKSNNERRWYCQLFKKFSRKETIHVSNVSSKMVIQSSFVGSLKYSVAMESVIGRPLKRLSTKNGR